MTKIEIDNEMLLRARNVYRRADDLVPVFCEMTDEKLRTLLDNIVNPPFIPEAHVSEPMLDAGNAAWSKYSGTPPDSKYFARNKEHDSIMIVIFQAMDAAREKPISMDDIEALRRKCGIPEPGPEAPEARCVKADTPDWAQGRFKCGPWAHSRLTDAVPGSVTWKYHRRSTDSK